MRRLTLKAEHLAELTEDELQQAVGGTYSFGPCLFSLENPCLSRICSIPQCIETS